MQISDLIKSYESIKLNGEELYLLPEKAIYWPKYKALLLADLHLGKTAHFRKNGFALPSNSGEKNWLILHRLFKREEIERVIFLGDLFHSDYNKEWEVFGELLETYAEIDFELVLGNHDILDDAHYLNKGFKIHREPLLMGPFMLSHEPLEEHPDYYNLAGHIHPGVRLVGKGRQSHKAACFYFGERGGILPAFGSLTGLALLEVKETDQVFVIVKDQVIAV